MNPKHENSDSIRDAFINEVVGTEKIYCLMQDENVGNILPDGEVPIILFWSKHALADRFKDYKFQGFERTEIPLFDFLYVWLMDLYQNGVRVGLDWNETIGFAIQPDELQNRFSELIPEELSNRYTAIRESDPSYSYVCLGIYSNSDARALLEAFDQENVRFNTETDATQIKGMDAASAYLGGTCGLGSKIIITVHEEDLEKADSIQQKTFKLET